MTPEKSGPSVASAAAASPAATCAASRLGDSKHSPSAADRVVRRLLWSNNDTRTPLSHEIGHRSLPIGTWFVWPGPLPKRQKLYQPKVYCVLDNHRPSAAVHTDLGHWTEATGPNAPGAAHARASLIAAALNERKASIEAARTYLEEYARTRLAETVHSL